MESTKKPVNKILYRVFSAILAIVSVFAILASVKGLGDFINIYCNLQGCSVGEMVDSFVATPGQEKKDEPEEIKDERFTGAAAQLYELYDGLNQLSDNETVYFDGLKQLADGKKQIADNTQAYKEGKETLATVQKILPYITAYQNWRDGSIANIPGFSTAQEYFVKVVRPLAAELGLEIDEDVNDLPQYVQDMVVDGKAQLKMYEDGLVQIADGEKQLAQFEDGEAQIISEGYDTIFSMPSYADKNGNVVIESPADHFGYKNGTFKNEFSGKTLGNGKKALNLDSAFDVLWFTVDYAHNVEDTATNELIPRAVLTVAGLLCGILGLVAGLKGLLFFRGKILTIVTAVAGIALNIAGMATGYNNYLFRLADGSYSGNTQMTAFILFAVAAVISAVFAALNLNKKNKKEDAFEDIAE